MTSALRAKICVELPVFVSRFFAQFVFAAKRLVPGRGSCKASGNAQDRRLHAGCAVGNVGL